MQKKNKNRILKFLNLPAKLGLLWSETSPPLGPLDSCHQDLEFGPRMDIFDPLEPEL